MNTYNPDRWVVLKIKMNDERYYYRLLAGWSGDYLNGANWRANSGITEVKEDEDYFYFYGNSGSVYKCHKKCHGTNLIMNQVINSNSDRISVLPENTDFINFNWEIK